MAFLEPNQWTWIDMPELVASDGTGYGFDFRPGTGRNVLIYLHGGGVSLNAYTAARPSVPGCDPKDSYYQPHPWHYGEGLKHFGIMADEKDCPFYSWTVIGVPYCNGDFHCGNNDFPYTDLNGKPAVLYHHGYKNCHAVLDKALSLLDFEPEQVLICGCSAGGFGVALMADSIMEHFEHAAKITVCVDSALVLRDDWKAILSDTWRAPQKLVDLIHSDNLTRDCLEALYQKHGDRITVAYMGSMRDATLVEFSGIKTYGRLYATEEMGLRYERDMKAMMAELPFVRFYIYDLPVQSNLKLLNLTKHCILLDRECAQYVDEDGVTPIGWLNALCR